MSSAKWIGGFLGFINGGPIGALAGFALGWLFDQLINESSAIEADFNNREYDNNSYGTHRNNYAYDEQRYQEGQRNSFLFSMLALASYVIRADGKIMHSEMEVVREFLRQNFGEAAKQQGEQILLRLFEQQKQMGTAAFRTTIMQSCRQIAANMDYSQRLQLLNFLVIIAQADGQVAQEEVAAIRELASYLGISGQDVESMLNLRSGATDLESAYKVLGVSPDATNDEVKAAYRKMALQHHPDRVAALGEDVRQAAEKKFQEINDAKERIYKARGL
ncbi:MAG: TerB family tellurite resistance protein [Prevotella sp.]|nr:TerB family tellurite resistance protein [Prevotella sp.]